MLLSKMPFHLLEQIVVEKGQKAFKEKVRMLILPHLDIGKESRKDLSAAQVAFCEHLASRDGDIRPSTLKNINGLFEMAARHIRGKLESVYFNPHYAMIIVDVDELREQEKLMRSFYAPDLAEKDPKTDEAIRQAFQDLNKRNAEKLLRYCETRSTNEDGTRKINVLNSRYRARISDAFRAAGVPISRDLRNRIIKATPIKPARGKNRTNDPSSTPK